MNKQDAAKYLDVSVRTLEGHVSAGRLACTYIKGKTGKVADFAEDDLATFKQELQTVTARPKVIQKVPQDTQLAKVAEPASLNSNSTVPPWLVTVLQAAVEAGQASQRSANAGFADLAAKKLLTLDEAATLAGASRGLLRAAIANGTLQARQIGRGWKIRPMDLDAWLNSLFADSPASAIPEGTRSRK